MKKYLSYVAFVVLGASCVSVQQIDIDGNPVGGVETEKKALITSALAHNSGVVPLDWKSDDAKISITKPSENMEVALSDVKRTSFYRNFEGIDFRGGLAVRVIARVIDGDEKVKLRLLMTDNNGFVTNGKTVDNTIRKTSDFRPYFFRIKGAFKQTFPELQNVNGSNIRRMEFVVSPTGGRVTGKIEIQSIKILMDDEVYKTKGLVSEGAEGGVVQNSDAPMDWSADNGYAVSKVGEDLVVEATGVGPRYEQFSKKIPVTKATKMKVIVKYEGNVQPFLRFDLHDVNGFITNRKPGMVRLLPGGYKEYIIDYSDRLRQSYPKQVDVDGARIVKVTGFIDPAYIPFTGTIFIKSIELY